MTDHINHYIRKGKERFHRPTFGRFKCSEIFKENLDGWIVKSKYFSKYFIKWGQWVSTKGIFYLLNTKENNFVDKKGIIIAYTFLGKFL